MAVKVRYDNRTTRSAQCALPAPTDDDIAFAPVAHRLAQELWAPGMKVRLLGVAVTHFEEDGAPVQETLFDAAALGGDDRADATQGAALIRDEKKRRSLLGRPPTLCRSASAMARCASASSCANPATPPAPPRKTSRTTSSFPYNRRQ